MEILGSQDFRIGVLVGLALIVVPYLLILFFGFMLRPWVMAKAAGAPIPMSHILGMKIRGVPPELIVMAHIVDRKRGGSHDLGVVEATYLAFPEQIRTPSDLVALVDKHAAEFHGETRPRQ